MKLTKGWLYSEVVWLLPNILAAVFIIPTYSLAQNSIKTAEHTGGNNVKFNGSIGLYGELYDMSGAANRRPGSTGRMYFKPTLTLFNSMTLSADLMLSTEDNSNRQSINQFDLNPKWSWGNAHLGDFSENYSSLTLNGIRIRGTGISINPGKFRFSTIYGQTRRATSNSSANRSYSRQIYGGKIGVGRKTGSNIEMIFLRLKDKSSSLPSLTDSIIGPDSAQADSAANPWSQYPEENMVMAVSSNLELFKHKFTWKNEVAGSAFTRNTDGKQLEDVPSWANSIFKFRIGSRIDFAYKTELSFEARRWNIVSGYEFIGPGYSSLGLSALNPDRQQFRLGAYLKGGRWSIGLRGSLESDNLIDQKTYTTSRKRLNGSLNYRLIRWWNVILTGNVVNVSNDALNDTAKVDNLITMVGVNQVFAISSTGFFQNASLNYSSQLSLDDNPLHDNTDLRSHSYDIRLTTRASSNFTITPSVMVSRNRPGGADWNTTSSYLLNIIIVGYSQKLSTNFSFGPSYSGENRSFKTILTALYKITPMDYIQSDIRYTHFAGAVSTSDFDESVVSLSVSHRF